MTWRDNLAKNAPITTEDARSCCGFLSIKEALCDDDSRRVLMSVHAMLCYERADAMIEESNKSRT